MLQKGNIAIEIGGVVFCIEGAFPPEVVKEIKQIYHAFISIKNPEVFICVHCGKSPKFKYREENKILDSNTGWKFYSVNGKGTALIIGPDDHKLEPSIISIYSLDFKKNDVYITWDNFYEYLKKGSFPFLELMLVSILSLEKAVLLHSCSIMDRGCGYLFIGKSGSGKSTLGRLWQSGKATLLSEERTLVRKTNNYFQLFGVSKDRLFDSPIPQWYRLEKIFFIRHSPQNIIYKSKKTKTFSQLLARSSLPFWDNKKLPYVFNFLNKLVSEISSYDLGFVPDASAVDYVRKWK